MNILLVKDKTLNVELLSNVLTKLLCTVDVAINYEEFENLAGSVVYNLRLLNLSLFLNLKKLLVLVCACLCCDGVALSLHRIEAYKIDDRAQPAQVFLECERGSGRIRSAVSGG
ncbi:hypothetical protein QUB80_02210 [Chlorogloeopsis sp. ULAP01]|uniref:hypothetical protein n=1 Tax=Chlorogloeopsis sp. ULAP01 TaxID=3056483 RepID=UPI0025AB2C15|nr:hypothetical protein [Chlorogloeopsis sp. ULAP01]MDM9379515.1 hypothetical protein [Chlorogloeopsis sp. ULAP01]